MRGSRAFVGLIAWSLLSAVNCFVLSKNQLVYIIADGGKLGQSPRFSISTRPTSTSYGKKATWLPSMLSVKKGSLFGVRDNKRFSLGWLLQRITHLRRPLKKIPKRLAALVFAACLFLQVGLAGVAHASTSSPPISLGPIEAVISAEQSLIRKLSGGFEEAATSTTVTTTTTSSTQIEETAVEQHTPALSSSKLALKSKLGTALVATIAVGTSAGFIYSSFNSRKETQAEQDATPSENKTTNAENPGEKDIVKTVWERAKSESSRLRVDADAYLKSVQVEKSLISSALDKLNEQLESATKADDIKRTQVVKPRPPVVAEKRVEVTAAPVATNAELPLMTKKYIEARKQPKSPSEEARLKKKYGAYTDVGERAFAILVDLGMIEVTDSVVEATLLQPGSTDAFATAEADDEPFQ